MGSGQMKKRPPHTASRVLSNRAFFRCIAPSLVSFSSRRISSPSRLLPCSQYVRRSPAATTSISSTNASVHLIRSPAAAVPPHPLARRPLFSLSARRPPFSLSIKGCRCSSSARRRPYLLLRRRRRSSSSASYRHSSVPAAAPPCIEHQTHSCSLGMHPSCCILSCSTPHAMRPEAIRPTKDT